MSFRHYNAFLRAAKSEHDISHYAAQELYRNVRDHLERTPFGTDVAAHPRIVSSYIGHAERFAEREKTERAERRAELVAERLEAEEQKRADSLEEFEEQYDEADEFDFEEYTGAFDTGKAKK